MPQLGQHVLLNGRKQLGIPTAKDIHTIPLSLAVSIPSLQSFPSTVMIQRKPGRQTATLRMS